MSSVIHRLETVGSTNDHLKMLAERGADGETAVVATVQTAGRGRHGRRWESVEGGSIFASVLYRPRAVSASLASLTLDVATAVAGALSDLGFSIGLEWPNDLVAEGRKLGGILCELHTHGTLPFIVIGVGVNGNVAPSAFPASLASLATSLQILGGARVNVEQVTDRLVEAVREACRAFDGRGRADIAAYVAQTASIGRRVTTLGGRAGTVDAIADDGALVVRFDDAKALESVRAGMVTHQPEARLDLDPPRE
ncbi:MAG: BirA family biotin operon repressor/biotin-[acetyl-CoA-carboxylase] ligase [Myxococcota bacterium]